MGAGKSAKQSKATAKKARAAVKKKGRERTAQLRPVIVDIADPLWNNEARMVVAVTAGWTPADCGFDQLCSYFLMLGFDSAEDRKVDSRGEGAML